MKNNLKKLSASMLSLIIIAIALIAFVTSCSKSSTGVSFTGAYDGTFALNGSLYSESDTISIPASNSSAVVLNSKTSLGSTYSMNATVSGTNLTVPSQSVYIASSDVTYTVSGSGTLTNSTLVINLAFVTSGNITYNWTFTGTKK